MRFVRERTNTYTKKRNCPGGWKWATSPAPIFSVLPRLFRYPWAEVDGQRRGHRAQCNLQLIRTPNSSWDCASQNYCRNDRMPTVSSSSVRIRSLLYYPISLWLIRQIASHVPSTPPFNLVNGHSGGGRWGTKRVPRFHPLQLKAWIRTGM